MQDLFRSLPAILNSVEGGEAIREAFIMAAWKRIAGEGLAAQTVALRFEGVNLTVAVSSETWRRHLADMSAQMLFKLNAVVGNTVKFIEFVVDAQAVESSRVQRVGSSDVSALAELTPELKRSAEAIADGDLREQFLAAAANCLARKKRLAL